MADEPETLISFAPGHEGSIMKSLSLLVFTLAATVASAQGAYDTAALNAFHAEREKLCGGQRLVHGCGCTSSTGENKFGSDRE